MINTTPGFADSFKVGGDKINAKFDALDVTNATQDTAIAGKAPLAHTHVVGDVTGLQTALDAKAALTHTHLMSDVSGLASALAGKANSTHSHAIADVTGLQTALDSKPALVHTHAIADVSGLQVALDAKAALTHAHAMSDVTGLSTALAGKAPTAHTHIVADITGLQTALDTKVNTTDANIANGYVKLDSSGKIPAVLVPGSVDTIIEAATFSALPATGAGKTLYVTKDDGKTYRWSGTAYTLIVASPGTTDAVTEGSVNLYFTNARAQAALTASLALKQDSLPAGGDGQVLTYDSAQPGKLKFATPAAAPGAVTATDNGLMIAADKVKLDGFTAFNTNAPAALGAANAGSSTAPARSDHVHPLPAVATTTADGLMASADKVKLDGLVTVLTDKGAWAASTAYALNDVVTQNNQRFVCKTAHTSAAAFGTDSAKWVLTGSTTSLLTDKGAWTASTAYALNDVVTQNNQRFVCITANSDATFTASKWVLSGSTTSLVSDKGAWTASTAYALNDVVTQNNQRFVCVSANNDATFTAAKWVLTGSTTSLLNDRGAWTASTAYALNDVVTQSNQRFVCITANNDATFTAAKWVALDAAADILTDKGAWTASTAYALNDVVTQSGTRYACISANSDATFTASKWVSLGISAFTSTTYAYCRGAATAVQSIPNGVATPTKITGLTRTGDNLLASDKITIVTAGRYRIDGTVTYAAATNGGAAAIIRLNGNTVSQAQVRNANGPITAATGITLDLVVGDYIELFALQDSGAALNTYVGSGTFTGMQPTLEVQQIPALGFVAPSSTGLVERGAWVASTAYAVNDVVTQNSARYVCAAANNDASFTSSKWVQLSGSVAAMVGASTSAAGTGGTAPAPAAGEGVKVLFGNGAYEDPLPSYDNAKTWAKGRRVALSPGLLIYPNDDIPGGTTFAWGTTGKTWSVVVGEGKKWIGMYPAAGGTINAYDVFASYQSAGAQLFCAMNGGWLSTGDAFTDCMTSGNFSARHAFPYANYDEGGNMTRMIGSTSTYEGRGGTVPQPFGGDNDRVLYGSGEWKKVPTPYELSQFYVSGERCLANGYLASANSTVTLNAGFSWGKTGATFSMLFPVSGLAWKGVYAASTAYAVNDVFVAAAAIGGAAYIVQTAFTSSASGFTTDVATAGGIAVGKVARIDATGTPLATATQAVPGLMSATDKTKLDGTAPGLVDKGAWTASTAYAVSDVVTQNNQRWVCKTANNDATFTAAKWLLTGSTTSLVSDKGAWTASTAYALNDIVTQANRRYVCTTANSDATFTASKWVLTGSTTDVVVDKGAWTASTAYALNDVVTRANRRYVCMTANSDATFTAAKWVALDAAAEVPTDKGAWVASTAYVLNDVVSLGPTRYVCIAANNDATFTASKWVLLGSEQPASGTLVAPYDFAKDYVAGDRTFMRGLLIEANGTVAKNTAFSWGTTGATWKPLISGNWRGVYTKNTSYAAGDLFVPGSWDNAPPFRVSGTFTSGNVNATDNGQFWVDCIHAGGVAVGYLDPVITSANGANYGEYTFGGATGTAAGRQGMVPRPASGFQRRLLRGDGGWTPAPGTCIKVRQTAAQSLTSGSNTVIDWTNRNLELNMDSNLYTIGNKGITTVLAGYYRVSGVVCYAYVNTTGYRCAGLQYSTDGGNNWVFWGIDGVGVKASGGIDTVQYNTVLYCGANVLFSLNAFQDSTVNCNTNATGPYWTFMIMEFMGT